MPSSSPDVYIEEHNVVIAPGGVAVRAWPVNWSAIWVGALASLAVALIFGLIGTAIGAHQVGKKVVNLDDLTLGGLIFSVGGAFFAFVVGGWVASSIAGLRRAEDAALHGTIAWLAALPLFLFLVWRARGNAGLGHFIDGYGGSQCCDRRPQFGRRRRDGAVDRPDGESHRRLVGVGGTDVVDLSPDEGRR
jgi:hypothetical protein